MNTLSFKVSPSGSSDIDIKYINVYNLNEAKIGLPAAITSAGHFVQPKVVYRTVSMDYPVAVYTQILFSRHEAWAIAEVSESTCKVQLEVSGKLSLRCDEETWNFVDRNKLIGHMMAYVMMAANCFKLTESPSCRLIHDPENDDQYLLADMYIKGDIEEILGSEDRFRSMTIDLIQYLPMIST